MPSRKAEAISLELKTSPSPITPAATISDRPRTSRGAVVKEPQTVVSKPLITSSPSPEPLLGGGSKFLKKPEVKVDLQLSKGPEILILPDKTDHKVSGNMNFVVKSVKKNIKNEKLLIDGLIYQDSEEEKELEYDSDSHSSFQSGPLVSETTKLNIAIIICQT